jgi:ketosteroid isomerase-like protein
MPRLGDTTVIDDAFFARYQRAWTNLDVDAIVEMMTEDGVYEASFGPEPWGQRFVGRDAIREALIRIKAARPATHEYKERFIFGNHGFSRWTSTSSTSSGETVSVEGADFYEFKDGLVSQKIAFRKASS